MSTIDVIFEAGAESRVVARAAQQGTETFSEYTDEHVARAADLAPVRHPPHARTCRFVGRTPEHLLGLLTDALPDSWGQLVLRRDMRQHGTVPTLFH